MPTPEMPQPVYLRPPESSDEREFLASVKKSGDLHSPWTSPPSTPENFRAYMEKMSTPENAAFLVCRHADDCLVGVFNITNIVRGAFQSGYLGYYVFAGHERQGLMRKGLEEVVRFAFQDLKLHRLEANIQPTNVASIALVKACGFMQEGYSPRYLNINGRWCDHERWAILDA
ncbi:GNAT family N-acetyltransferase [Variovorax sp.]|uniref:GNAT family N-acetyltransferase n=1 Tax=Variovorax sp. TaxID=1871043 RepID=UPI003BABFACB